ncbi:MAG TPA: hypothetical protein GXX42_09140, partial [Petrimonas sp.]|uniref:hypothetical protein n=1 Tax=Petrimonas sp. TaxID=2023866 RepID=UPI0017788E3B|nr:hypothetical protein [Petrimonas sp.]
MHEFDAVIREYRNGTVKTSFSERGEEVISGIKFVINSMCCPDTNEQILECLHILISKNVTGNRPYSSRYKGFIGELEFAEWFRNNRPGTVSLTGGYLLPVNEGQETLNCPVYFTVSPESCFSDAYINVYRSLGQIPCKSMYFIRWNDSAPFGDWRKEDIMKTGTGLPVPELNVYLFDNEKSDFTGVPFDTFLKEFRFKRRPDILRGEAVKASYIQKMRHYNETDLLKLYVQRLIFDGFLGFGVKKGLPGDIDFIINSGVTHEMQFLEIKEKDLSKGTPRGFGMDVRRIDDLRRITQKTGIEYFYIVRRVDNQAKRNFVEWLIIDMNDFVRNTGDRIIPGGSGMRKEGTYNPTRICPYEVFK